MTQTKFEMALSFHQNGNFDAAKVLYEEILKTSSDHAGALHLSGLICMEEKRPDLAEKFLAEAIRVKADFAPHYLGYGVALMELGRFDDALVNYHRAIFIKPDYAEAFYNRGNALKDLGRLAEAIADYAEATALDPQNAQAFSNQGDALQSLGDFDDALVRYAKAISLAPDYAEAYSNRGLALHEMKHFDRAITSYDRAVALDPELSVAWFNRGNTLKKLGRFEEAVTAYTQALMIAPSNAEACSNMGDALQSLGRFTQALSLYERAIALRPGFAEAWSNRGVCLKALKLFAQALASFDQATALAPNYAEAPWNKALTLLLTERFEEGWKLYEWRKKAREPAGDRFHHRPAWLGQDDLFHKTLLVHAEQGLGDTIQFSRYLGLLRTQGARVLFAPQSPLRGLMSKLDAACEILDEGIVSPEFDFHISLMSLPLVFSTDLWNMPARAAYLHAEEERVEKWKDRIGFEGFRIAICWQGNTGNIDIGRSFSVHHFFDLSQIPGLRLISLQKGPGEAQLQGLPPGMGVETLGADFDAGPDAFLDTAAVMQCCDLVITSDTAVAHLAGALGVKTWVALKHVPDWRWFLDRDDSPWYPSMRLFRQEFPGDWDGVFANMKAALMATPSVRESGSIPSVHLMSKASEET